VNFNPEWTRCVSDNFKCQILYNNLQHICILLTTGKSLSEVLCPCIKNNFLSLKCALIFWLSIYCFLCLWVYSFYSFNISLLLYTITHWWWFLIIFVQCTIHILFLLIIFFIISNWHTLILRIFVHCFCSKSQDLNLSFTFQQLFNERSIYW